MIDDCNINNLAKSKTSAVFHLLAICRSVSPKFIELGWRRHVCALQRDANVAAVT